MTFRAFRQSLVPTTHQRPTGQALQGALGDVEDAYVARYRAAVKMRFPLLAPPDALRAIGVERQIPQGPGEGFPAYAARLQDAWNTWPWAGTAYGLLRALRATGYSNVVLAQTVGDWQYTLDAGGNLVLGGDGSWTATYVGDPLWSRFDLLFVPPLPASWIASGVPASTSSEANLVRALVAAWKPGHATAGRIVIITAGGVWDYQDGTWDDGGTWDASTTTVWTP